AGKNLTRDGAMNAALHLNLARNPFLLPGIRVHTTPSDRFPITQAYLQQWHRGAWRIISPLLSARGWPLRTRPGTWYQPGTWTWPPGPWRSRRRPDRCRVLDTGASGA